MIRKKKQKLTETTKSFWFYSAFTNIVKVFEHNRNRKWRYCFCKDQFYWMIWNHKTLFLIYRNRVWKNELNRLGILVVLLSQTLPVNLHRTIWHFHRSNDQLIHQENNMRRTCDDIRIESSHKWSKKPMDGAKPNFSRIWNFWVQVMFFSHMLLGLI